MKNFQKLTFIATGLLLITSCNNQESTKELNGKKAIIEVDTTNIYNKNDYDIKLPEPYVLVSSFEDAGVEFDATRMNDPENISNYNTEGKQLLNYGIFSSDLIYCIINEQAQYSIKNFNATKKIAVNLGMGSIYSNEKLASEIEDNIGDREKMEALLFDIHDKSLEYLKENEVRVLAAIQFAGSWVEGMYLGTFDIDNKDIKKLGVKVADNMNILKTALGGLEAYVDRDGNTNNVLTELKALQTQYNDLDNVKNAKGIPELTKEDVKELAEKIHQIRDMIVS